jgi:hypothetical protein
MLEQVCGLRALKIFDELCVRGQYKNRSRIRKAAGWTSCSVMRSIWASAMEPKSCALKTGERAARMARCAQNVSPPTEKETSEPSVHSSRCPRWSTKSVGGTGTRSLPLRSMIPHTNVTQPSTR